MNEPLLPEPVPTQGLVVRMSERYGLEPNKFLSTIKATAFRTEKPISNEQLAALLLVSERHGLDPFTREIYAFPDKVGGIVPVVSIDGWLRIINEHPEFDGMETHWDEGEASMTCTIWRKDRRHPIRVTEYVSECRRDTPPWRMVHRMMRHKATMQCARYAFGFAGIHDDDEAQDIMRGVVASPPSAPVQAVRHYLRREVEPAVVVEPDPEPDIEVAPPPPVDEDVDLVRDEPADLPIKDGEVAAEPAPRDAPPTVRRSARSTARPAFDVAAYARRINACTNVDTLTVMHDEVAALAPTYERDELMSVVDARMRELLPPQGEGEPS